MHGHIPKMEVIQKRFNENTRVAYRDNNLNHANDIFHSAIAVDSYYVVSKWGGPLFKHSSNLLPLCY